MTGGGTSGRRGRCARMRLFEIRPRARHLDATRPVAYNYKVHCPRGALARGSREPGQALTGAAISGVLLCGGLFWAVGNDKLGDNGSGRGVGEGVRVGLGMGLREREGVRQPRVPTLSLAPNLPPSSFLILILLILLLAPNLLPVAVGRRPNKDSAHGGRIC
jgi:hypothetical protein